LKDYRGYLYCTQIGHLKSKARDLARVNQIAAQGNRDHLLVYSFSIFPVRIDVRMMVIAGRSGGRGHLFLYKHGFSLPQAAEITITVLVVSCSHMASIYLRCHLLINKLPFLKLIGRLARCCKITVYQTVQGSLGESLNKRHISCSSWQIIA